MAGRDEAGRGSRSATADEFRDRAVVVGEQPVGQLGLVVGAIPAVVLDAGYCQKRTSPPAALSASNIAATGAGDDVIVGAVEDPGRGAADGVGVFGGQGCDLAPALGLIATRRRRRRREPARRPAVRVGFGQLPCAVAAEREAGEVDASRIAVELLDF